jgi:hypothetical protein
MTQKLGKIEPKKMMAYPFNDKLGYDYETYQCYHCKEKYLTQGVIDIESVFCPMHKDYEFCMGCDKCFDLNELENVNDAYYCNNCMIPKCLECGEKLNNLDDKYCSQDCYVASWKDLNYD